MKRYCSSGQHETEDDGKGVLRQAGDRGAKRWVCSSCNAKKKAGQSPFDFSKKSNAGRKPKPKYDVELAYDATEERQIIKEVFGL